MVLTLHLQNKQSLPYCFIYFFIYTAAAFSLLPLGDILISRRAPNKLPPWSCQSVKTDVWNSDSQELLARKNTITASSDADARQIIRLEQQSVQIVLLVLLPRTLTLSWKTAPPSV